MKKKLVCLLMTFVVALASVFTLLVVGTPNNNILKVKGGDDTSFTLSTEDATQLSSDTYELKLKNYKGASVNVNVVGANYVNDTTIGSTNNPDLYIYNTEPFRGFNYAYFDFSNCVHAFIAFSYNPLNLNDLLNGKYQDVMCAADFDAFQLELNTTYFPSITEARYFLGFAYSVESSSLSINEVVFQSVCEEEPQSVEVGTNSGVLTSDEKALINQKSNSCGTVSDEVGNGAYYVWNPYEKTTFFSQITAVGDVNNWSWNFVSGFDMGNPEPYVINGTYLVKFTKNNDVVKAYYSTGRYFDLYTLMYEERVSTNVSLWVPFGVSYTSAINNAASIVSANEKINLEVESKGGYENLYHEVMYNIPSNTYPDLIGGYPNNFIEYANAQRILKDLDSVLTPSEIDDYLSEDLATSYFTDRNGDTKLYSVPFLKSTEALVYNGAFVDFCAEQYNDSSLKVIPETWTDWALTSSASKVQKYKSCLELLYNSHTAWYATVEVDGSCHDFSTTQGNNQVQIFDYSETYYQPQLFGYESLDNAFITLLKQWDAEYTRFDYSESLYNFGRKGHIAFVDSNNINKTIDMLKFFRTMRENVGFATYHDVGGYYFDLDNCMFNITSTASINNYSSNPSVRFAPIPYYSSSRKYVMNQGSNLCLTDHAPLTDNTKKALIGMTTGEINANLAINTGYFTGSKSALNSSTYQAFLNSTDTSNISTTYKRQTAQLYYNTYLNTESTGWSLIEDLPFVDSSQVRNAGSRIFEGVLRGISSSDINNDNAYLNLINNELSTTVTSSNIVID